MTRIPRSKLLQHTLVVTVVSARDLHNTQLVGIQDPLVELFVGKTKFQTSVVDDGGSSAMWNEIFHFHHLAKNDILQKGLRVKVWNINITDR